SSDMGVIKRPLVIFANPAKQESLAEQMKHYTPRAGWRPPQAQVIASGEPMLLAEVTSGQREQLAYDDRHAAVLSAAGIRSLMVVPLSARAKTFGALTVAITESDRRFTPADLSIARGLASRVAVSVDNSRLYDDARRANKTLQREILAREELERQRVYELDALERL